MSHSISATAGMLLSITILLASIILPMANPQPAYADSAVFTIIPPTLTVNAGESCNISVQLSTNAATDSAGFQLSWLRTDGAASMTCTGIDKGTFYTNGVLLGQGRYSDNGTIEQYAVGLIGSSQPAGTGPLAIIHLRATQPGTYNLHLFECQASYQGDMVTSSTADGQVTVPAGPPPQAPYGLAATSVMWNGIGLHWSDNSTDEDSFRIQRAFNTDFPTDNTTNFDLPADTVNYSDNTTGTNTAYYFRILAHNANGWSAPSNVVQVTTPPPPPDLVMTQLSETLYDDNSFDVRFTVCNQGTTAAPTSIAGIYLDEVDQPDFDPTISALSQGRCQTRVVGPFYATLPNHVIRVCSDRDNQIIELSETNNCQQNTLHVPWPDLVVSQVYEDVTGNQFYVSFTVCNTGEKATFGTTTATIYVNGEHKLDQQVPVLAVGQCYSTSQPLGPWLITLPPPTIKLCADSQNTEIEINEQNNCLENVLPLPDLMVLAPFTMQWVSPGSTYNITYTIKNLGDGPAAESSTSIAIDGQVAQTVPCSALAPGASDNRTAGPFTLSPDSDAIRIMADSGEAVFESKEYNNALNTIWNGMPDLQVTTLSEQWISQGSTYNIIYTVRNQGTAPAAASSTSISLDGRVAQTLPCSALATGASENRTAGPFTLSPDSDAIVVTADSANVITESNETNNSRSDTLNGITDLRVTIISPQWTTEYTVYNINYRVQNIGTYPSTESSTSISVDGVAQTMPCPELPTGAFYSQTVGPFTFSPENDDIVIIADKMGAVAESNENNNTTELIWEVSPRWDINMDHVLDTLDLSIFVNEWNITGPPGWTRSDWNRDGKVDVLDFSGIFTTHWNQRW